MHQLAFGVAHGLTLTHTLPAGYDTRDSHAWRVLKTVQNVSVPSALTGHSPASYFSSPTLCNITVPGTLNRTRGLRVFTGVGYLATLDASWTPQIGEL
ncbi:hypothetical protein BDZ89DRAFT_1138619 [Hymenopellis radicata]|nr:hypothetical protein BDZ89DRAFT_1138619 [Hymenopellis radicata]